MNSTIEHMRTYWDADADTYDRGSDHTPRSSLERAAWAAALCGLLPPPPAAVLDVGAGTGFLSLLLAAHGYHVTALDLSPRMLDRLRSKASAAGVDVQTHEGPADEPPAGGFAAVVQRHVLWTQPDPVRTLNAWQAAAPDGRLLLLESMWGVAAGPADRVRIRARRRLRELRREPSSHHAELDPAVTSALPLAGGATPERLVELVESSRWGAARVERLRDVEWAARRALPGSVDRLIGVPPRYAITAGG
ncbi:class I SAM-dependent methyltransferase [soil metagenome]|jgi:SAM-dependent methyltransferase